MITDMSTLSTLSMRSDAAEPAAPRDIESITADILDAKRAGGQAIITIGQRLTEAKALLAHGEWLDWLAERVEFSERSAQAFMRISRECSNPQLVADLGVRKALALLALPPAEREEFAGGVHEVNGEAKAVTDMTARELEQAIRERDEARRGLEAAQADAKIAQESRQELERQLKLTAEMLDRARTEKELADGAAAALEQQLAELKAAPVEVAVMAADQEALDRARAEGESARAEELAALQARLDKAQAAKKKADEKRKEAEAAVDILKLQMEAAAKSREKAAAAADPDVAKFEVYFNQAQEAANKLRGLLLKARGREDQSTAEKLSRAMLALGEKIKEGAQ